jgi:CheY-like chemotaxis protein
VEPRGEISVTVGRGTPPGEIVIAIRDTGVGIAKENIGKIFDPFFTTKGPLGGGKGHGTGLGLTVCYNIVQSRGGKIAVESEVGKGTTFTVTLPAHDGPLPRRDEAPGNAPVAAGAAGVRRRLLVVDDEEPVREMLREYLCEHDVHCCASGEEAVTAYRTRPFDYVVLDLCMENSQSGVETLHELKAIDPEARVILASGRLPEDIPAAALALAHGHLLKPFQLDALAALLGIRPA